MGRCVHEADEKWGGESKGAVLKWGGESVTRAMQAAAAGYGLPKCVGEQHFFRNHPHRKRLSYSYDSMR